MFLIRIPQLIRRDFFALLISLADLVVEIGADDGAERTLNKPQIAERFVQPY